MFAALLDVEFGRFLKGVNLNPCAVGNSIKLKAKVKKIVATLVTPFIANKDVELFYSLIY